MILFATLHIGRCVTFRTNYKLKWFSLFPMIYILRKLFIMSFQPMRKFLVLKLSPLSEGHQKDQSCSPRADCLSLSLCLLLLSVPNGRLCFLFWHAHGHPMQAPLRAPVVEDCLRDGSTPVSSISGGNQSAISDLPADEEFCCACACLSGGGGQPGGEITFNVNGLLGGHTWADN